MSCGYVLDGKTPRLGTWEEIVALYGQGIDARRVASTEVGLSWVSTVFLVHDHQYGDGPPLLFETLVFEGVLDGECERYATWEEAERGHAEMVRRVREAEGVE